MLLLIKFKNILKQSSKTTNVNGNAGVNVLFVLKVQFALFFLVLNKIKVYMRYEKENN